MALLAFLESVGERNFPATMEGNILFISGTDSKKILTIVKIYKEPSLVGKCQALADSELRRFRRGNI